MFPGSSIIVVQGIYRSGVPEQELHTVLRLSRLSYSFLRRADVVSQWEVTVKEFRRGSPSQRAKFGGSRLNSKRKIGFSSIRNSFGPCRLERISMFVILAFIIVVASFNIVTTLTLMVLEKKEGDFDSARDGARVKERWPRFSWLRGFDRRAGRGRRSGFGFCGVRFLRKAEVIELPDVFYDRTLRSRSIPGIISL